MSRHHINLAFSTHKDQISTPSSSQQNQLTRYQLCIPSPKLISQLSILFSTPRNLVTRYQLHLLLHKTNWPDIKLLLTLLETYKSYINFISPFTKPTRQISITYPLPETYYPNIYSNFLFMETSDQISTPSTPPQSLLVISLSPSLRNLLTRYQLIPSLNKV